MNEHDTERKGEPFEGDLKLTVIGAKLRPGDRAPDFALDALAPGEGVLREVTLASSTGHPLHRPPNAPLLRPTNVPRPAVRLDALVNFVAPEEERSP